MAWSDALARVKTVLEAVEITSPVEKKIKRVYDFPPSTVQDTPAFVLFPPACTVERLPGLHREKVYTLRMRLLVHDTDVERGAAIVDAYREAVLDAFDSELTLNGEATAIEGPSIEEPGVFDYAGRDYLGMDCILTVEIHDQRTFS